MSMHTSTHMPAHMSVHKPSQVSKHMSMRPVVHMSIHISTYRCSGYSNGGPLLPNLEIVDSVKVLSFSNRPARPLVRI